MKKCPFCGSPGSQIFIHFECSAPGCPNNPNKDSGDMRSFATIDLAIEYLLGEVYQKRKQVLWLCHDPDKVKQKILTHPGQQLHFLPTVQTFTSYIGTMVKVRETSVVALSELTWDLVLHSQKSEFTLAGPHSEMYDWVRNVMTP